MSALEASIGAQMMKTAEGNLFQLSDAAGLMLGMVVMWATAFARLGLVKRQLTPMKTIVNISGSHGRFE